MKPRIMIGLAAAAALTATEVAAATIRVPQDQPTIQAAVDAAQVGDTIAVGKGTHAPFVVGDRSDLRIKGKGKPIVDGQGAEIPVLVQGSQDVTLDGLVLTNSGSYGMRILGSDRITVRRCTIENSPDDGLEIEDASDLVIEKNRFQNLGEDGIDFRDAVEAGDVVDSRISKNRFEEIEGGGLLVDGRNIVIEKNRVARAELGIAIDYDEASDNTITKNKIEDTGENGIEAQGTGNVVEKNHLRRTGEAAILIRADETRVEKNKIDASGDEGIDVIGSDNQILRNVVKKPGGAGIDLGDDNDPGSTTNNLIERNKILQSAVDGIYVEDTGNVFRRNIVKKSTGSDLHDITGPEGNTYEDNKFGSEDFS